MTDVQLKQEEIVRLAERSGSIDKPCACATRTIPGWESVPITFPEELLDCLGRVSPPSEELTVKEYHPRGTNYWSSDAPIALNYFPANHSEIWQCRVCARCFLRYTEFGGYYVDKRIRSLRPEMLTLAEFSE
jgi:hypothetical protein